MKYLQILTMRNALYLAHISFAISLARDSERDYKTLFTNAGMSREYNYFKKAKEVVTREDDINFEELRNKLIN